MHKIRSYQTHDKHQALYDALLNSLILNDDIACGQADAEKVLRKRDRDREDPSAGPNQGKKTKRSRTKESNPSKKSSTSKESSNGKSPAKTSKSSKSVTVEEPVEEPVFKMASDDIEQTIDDVANDVDQPPDDSTQTKDKAPKQDWFKQPPRPPTPDPEWNKRQVVLDQPEQPWFNQMVSGAKDPLSSNELMATPINFSNIELEYNMEECFKALIEKLNWNNPEGDRDQASSLKSATKVGYNKDAEKRIKHWGEKRQLWYRSQMNKFSKHYVYSTQKILSVVSVSVKKLHGYGHLEEIAVRRADRKVYKFKEGNFLDLHLNDIKDMLLLVVQHKLF
ncbi:hypothetical protein Tco_1495747 [Tanacetum coccineum]